MGISRKEPLFLGFSTAGDEQTTWGYQQWDFGTRNNESGEDLHFFFQSYEGKQTASDAEIAAHLDSYIRAANPALGHTVRIEEVPPGLRQFGQEREVETRVLQVPPEHLGPD